MIIKQSILIVDDRPYGLHTLQALLDSEHWLLLTASTGLQALSLMRDHNVSLVILDTQISKMDCFDLVGVMRKDERMRDVPIIFLNSGRSEEKNIYRGYQLGAFEYLHVPFNPEILKLKVDCVMKLDYQNRLLEKQLAQLDAYMAARQNEQQKIDRRGVLVPT